MKRKTLRRVIDAIVILALVVGAAVLLTGGVGSTFALLSAVTQNTTSDFAGGWVGAPVGPSSSASGYDSNLAWTAGTAGPVTGQALLGVDNGTNSSCTGAAYAALTTSPAFTATTASYTDLNRGTSTTDGDWYCYELESTSATTWTAQTAVPALQIGLAASGVTIANGGTAAKIDKGDTITLTFNQKTSIPAATSTLRVCVFTSGTIVLGDTSGACTSGTDASSIGTLKISGGTITGSTETSTASSVAVSSSAPWTVTVTLGTISSGSASVSGTPTWTYTPVSTVVSSLSTLTTALSTTGTTTSLKVNATPWAIPAETVTVTSGTHTQTFAASAAAAGATSITVTGQTANFAYPIGSTVSPDVAAACTATKTTCQPTTTSSF